MASEQSSFVRISDNYYAILNTYENNVYVHLHNKHNKKKRFSMKYDDLMSLVHKEKAFERALDKLYAEEDDNSGSSDDDMAYKTLTASDDTCVKKAKHSTDAPSAKKSKQHHQKHPSTSSRD